MRHKPPAHASEPWGAAPRAPEIDRAASAWLARSDAGLDSAGEAALAQWRAADPRHEAAWRELNSAWRSFDRAELGPAADSMVIELAARRRQRQRRRWRAGVGAGAAFAAALAIAAFSRSEFGSAQKERAAGDASAVASAMTARLKAAGAELDANATAAIPRRQVLADGSIVELNSGAEIATSFSAARREVRLVRGEAHFEVQKDAARPFVVSAGAVQVRAVGTAFAVRLEPRAVDVLVTEGNVAIETATAAVRDINAPHGDAASNEPRRDKDGVAVSAASAPVGAGIFPTAIRGAAGDWVVVATAPGVAAADGGAADAAATKGANGTAATDATRLPAPRVESLSAEAIARRLAWRGLRIEFSGTPLAEAVAAFNRQNRVQLALGDAEIVDLRLSGVFRADNVEGFVRLLSSHYGVTVEREARIRGRDTIVLKKADQGGASDPP